MCGPVYPAARSLVDDVPDLSVGYALTRVTGPNVLEPGNVVTEARWDSIKKMHMRHMRQGR